MKKLSEILSPAGWGIVVVAAYSMWYFLLQPTWQEMLMLFLLDTALTIVLSPASEGLLKKLYPMTRLVLNGPDWERIEALPVDQRPQFVSFLMQLPKVRARHLVLCSFVKIIPALVLITLTWHNAEPSLPFLILVLMINGLFFTHFYLAVFVENHSYISDLLAEIHQRFDYHKEFKDFQPDTLSRQFSWAENLAVVTFWMFVIGLQATLLSRDAHAFEIIWIGFVGLMLFSRIWYLSRDYYYRGLSSLVNAFSELDPDDFSKSLPLHTEPQLARFEIVFNELTGKLQGYQKEVASMVIRHTDKSRYQAIGEFAGLLAHDLSGPLHVVQFCASELPNANKQESERLLARLNESVQDSIELVTSLKSYLRGEASPEGTSYSEIHRHVWRLVGTDLKKLGFNRLSLDFNDEVSGKRLQVSRADLIHIFFNLFSNSAKSMFLANCEYPRITVHPAEISDTHVVFGIRDFGTGLSRTMFDGLIDPDTVGPSLGLKLTYRLIQQWGGELEVGETYDNGTLLLLKLPLAQQKPVTHRPGREQQLRESDSDITL